MHSVECTPGGSRLLCPCIAVVNGKEDVTALSDRDGAGRLAVDIIKHRALGQVGHHSRAIHRLGRVGLLALGQAGTTKQQRYKQTRTGRGSPRPVLGLVGLVGEIKHRTNPLDC